MTIYPDTDYDSWISWDDAEAYFQTRLHSDEWHNTLLDIQEVALLTAFRSLNELDLNLVFTTDKVLSEAHYTDTQIIEILTALKQAQCEQTLHEIRNDPEGQSIERVNIGGLLSVSLPDKEGKQPPRYAQRAISMLRPYIRAPIVSRTR